MDITSANSQFILTVPGVFPTPQVIQGYAADDAFTQEAFDLMETRMGVDAILSGGYTPTPKRLSVMLQPDSPSFDVFSVWRQEIESQQAALVASATIVLPSIGKVFTFTKGFLKNLQAMPSAKKVLDPVPFIIEWESISQLPI